MTKSYFYRSSNSGHAVTEISSKEFRDLHDERGSFELYLRVGERRHRWRPLPMQKKPAKDPMTRRDAMMLVNAFMGVDHWFTPSEVSPRLLGLGMRSSGGPDFSDAELDREKLGFYRARRNIDFQEKVDEPWVLFDNARRRGDPEPRFRFDPVRTAGHKAMCGRELSYCISWCGPAAATVPFYDLTRSPPPVEFDDGPVRAWIRDAVVDVGANEVTVLMDLANMSDTTVSICHPQLLLTTRSAPGLPSSTAITGVESSTRGSRIRVFSQNTSRLSCDGFVLGPHQRRPFVTISWGLGEVSGCLHHGDIDRADLLLRGYDAGDSWPLAVRTVTGALVPRPFMQS